MYYTKPVQSTAKLLSVLPVPPGAVIATGSSTQNKLCWVEPTEAIGYNVKRTIKSGGPFTVIAKNITASNYIDKQIKPGTLYFYTVSAFNKKGESANANATAVAAGLPSPWNQEDIGLVTNTGITN